MIYRGFVIEQLMDRKTFVAHRKADPHVEACSSEDDAMAYVDSVKRREFKEGVEAAREAGA